VGKPEGKRPLERPRCEWEDNIKIDLRDIGWDVMDWILLAEEREQCRAFVHMVMNFQILYSTGKFLST
jgi:hypothetical protein